MSTDYTVYKCPWCRAEFPAGGSCKCPPRMRRFAGYSIEQWDYLLAAMKDNFDMLESDDPATVLNSRVAELRRAAEPLASANASEARVREIAREEIAAARCTPVVKSVDEIRKMYEIVDEQRVRDAALEEAAAVCDGKDGYVYLLETMTTMQNLAKEIRSLKSPPAAEARPATITARTIEHAATSQRDEQRQGESGTSSRIEVECARTASPVSKPAAAQESEADDADVASILWRLTPDKIKQHFTALEQERDILAKRREALLEDVENVSSERDKLHAAMDPLVAAVEQYKKERDEARGQSQRLHGALDAALDGLEWVGRTAKRDDFERRWNTVQDVACGASWKARRIRSGEEDCRLQPKEGK